MPVTERRIANPVDLDSLGIKYPGIARVEEENKRAVAEEDAWWQQNTDSTLWLSNYRLLQHLTNARDMLIEFGIIRGRDEEIPTRSIAGFNHDISKLREPYRSLYRKNGRLTDSEKVIMKGHTKEASEMLDEHKTRVRAQNREPFEEAKPIVRHHDEPHRIWKRKLRKIGFDLYMIDGFLAATEKRHDSAMTDEEAIKSVRRDSVGRLPFWARIIFWFEIRDSLRILPEAVKRTRTA